MWPIIRDGYFLLILGNLFPYISKKKFNSEGLPFSTWWFQESWEAVSRRCFVKKMFSKTMQNSYEKICAGASFLIKL